jgi:hypothetical protein
MESSLFRSLFLVSFPILSFHSQLRSLSPVPPIRPKQSFTKMRLTSAQINFRKKSLDIYHLQVFHQPNDSFHCFLFFRLPYTQGLYWNKKDKRHLKFFGGHNYNLPHTVVLEVYQLSYSFFIKLSYNIYVEFAHTVVLAFFLKRMPLHVNEGKKSSRISTGADFFFFLLIFPLFGDRGLYGNKQEV